MIRVLVVGVGGAGGNALSYMANEMRSEVRMLAINTDAQALDKLEIDNTLVIGSSGLGAGSVPEVAEKAMSESIDDIKKELKNTDILFIAAGMGGGTGTGAAHVLAREAKEMGLMTVSVVSMPFAFERRDEKANEGLDRLSAYSDGLVVISNDRIAEIYSGEFKEVFHQANVILSQAITSLIDLVEKPGLINIDFEDVKTILSYRGKSVFGSGHAAGDNAWKDAVEMALLHPLMNDVDLTLAKGVLVNVVSKSMTMANFTKIGDLISTYLNNKTHTIMGACFDDSVPDGEIRISVIVTGIHDGVTTESIIDRVKVDPLSSDLAFLFKPKSQAVNLIASS